MILARFSVKNRRKKEPSEREIELLEDSLRQRFTKTAGGAEQSETNGIAFPL